MSTKISMNSLHQAAGEGRDDRNKRGRAGLPSFADTQMGGRRIGGAEVVQTTGHRHQLQEIPWREVLLDRSAAMAGYPDGETRQ